MEGVRKTFGPKVAVEGMDLHIPAGSLCGFIGPNGAGKTTTIRMIMSIIFPDAGRLSVLGKKSAVESKDRIGYLPEERGVYRKMKVGAFLRHMAALKGVDNGADLSAKVADWLEKVELPGVEKKRCEELSKGMQQKVQFISSVIHEPELLILDEPFSGLDPVNMRLLRRLIDEQHGRGTTVIFSTHVMHQAEQQCDEVVMIHNGKKVLDDPIGAIRARYQASGVRFEPATEDVENKQAVTDAVASLPFIDGVNPDEGGMFEAEFDPARLGDADPVAAIAAAGRMARVELKRPTLEDIFINIVQGDNITHAERELFRSTLRTGDEAWQDQSQTQSTEVGS